jgi:HEAT repeat protein
VRFSFETRDGVCGNGRNISIRDEGTSEWESDCEAGPARVLLGVERGSVRSVETRVGGAWRAGTGATDLGTVAPDQAARYLLAIAETLEDDGDDAVFAATLARGVTVWPELLRLARNDGVPSDTRKGAVFWLGQAAGEAATAALDSIVVEPGDREVRKAAVFALSQRPESEGVPALIRVARTNPDPQLRRDAMFWLGQSEDPRAIDLFEELLAE